MRSLMALFILCVSITAGADPTPRGFVICPHPEPTGCVMKTQYSEYRRLSWTDFVVEETGIQNAVVMDIAYSCGVLVVYFTQPQAAGHNDSTRF